LDPDHTLIQIRERTYLELLDLALVVVRQRPTEIVPAALVGVAPFAAFNVWLMSQPDITIAQFLIVLLLEAPWASAPLTVVLGMMMFGERPAPKRVGRTLLRGLPALILFQGVVRFIVVATVFGYPFFPSRLAFLNEVILLEKGRVSDISERCATLCGVRGTEFFVRWLGQIVLGVMFVACFWFGVGAIQNALTTSELTWERPGLGDFEGAKVQIAAWIAIAFFAVVRFLSYIDQRIRLEGWELKLRLQAVGQAMEEAGRW
jgi:hypothetical protein